MNHLVESARAPRAPIAAIAVCTALGLLTGLQIYLARLAESEPSSIGDALAFGAVSWLPWAAAAPMILALGRPFAFQRGRRTLSGLVHLGVALALIIPIGYLIVTVSFALFAGPTANPLPATAIRQQVLSGTRLQLGMLIYALILGIGGAERLWGTLRAREQHAARLEALATSARLDALAARLQPHFLFNTLHTIGALVDEDPRRARQMLALLGDLLRDLLAEPADTEVPLEEELGLLGRYLDIETVRFADRLRVEVAVSPQAGATPVPRLLLQPIVENAIRHGIAPRAHGGQLRISAEVVSDRLRLVVWNDGLPLDPAHQEGVGIATTRERVSTRYPGATLVVRPAESGGVETVLMLPLRAV